MFAPDLLNTPGTVCSPSHPPLPDLIGDAERGTWAEREPSYSDMPPSPAEQEACLHHGLVYSTQQVCLSGPRE